MTELPDDNPPLKPIHVRRKDGDIFLRIRTDGNPGEEIEFIRDAGGQVVSMKQHSVIQDKMR